MAKQSRTDIDEGRRLIAKQYERLHNRLTMLPDPSTELSEQQLRQVLVNEEFPLVERLLNKTVSSPKKAHPRLEAAATPSSRNNARRPSPYFAYTTSKSFQDSLNSYQEQLSLLTKDELIEQIQGRREAIVKEIEGLTPKREWWTASSLNADFVHWCRKDYWTADEGIILSLGLDPREVDPEQLQTEKDYGGLPDEFSDRQEVVATSIQSKKIDSKKNDPKVFVAWLDAKGYSYPDELKKYSDEVHSVTFTGKEKPPQRTSAVMKFDVFK